MIIIDKSDDMIFIVTSIRKVMLKARIQCETFLSEHCIKSSFRGISMSKFHCVCSSSIKYCVYSEKISSDTENLIALVLIDKQEQKNSQRPKRIRMHIFRTSVNCQIPRLSSNECYIIHFYILITYGHIFFIERNCSFFMSIIFCSSVVLVWSFNTRVVYNFITKEVSFLFCRFWKPGVRNELKYLSLWNSKSESYLFQTGQNFAAHKTLVWSKYIWRTATATIYFKKE